MILFDEVKWSHFSFFSFFFLPFDFGKRLDLAVTATVFFPSTASSFNYFFFWVRLARL